MLILSAEANLLWASCTAGFDPSLAAACNTNENAYSKLNQKWVHIKGGCMREHDTMPAAYTFTWLLTSFTDGLTSRHATARAGFGVRSPRPKSRDSGAIRTTPKLGPRVLRWHLRGVPRSVQDRCASEEQLPT